jgi:hypothetical protein
LPERASNPDKIGLDRINDSPPIFLEVAVGEYQTSPKSAAKRPEKILGNGGAVSQSLKE